MAFGCCGPANPLLTCSTAQTHPLRTKFSVDNSFSSFSGSLDLLGKGSFCQKPLGAASLAQSQPDGTQGWALSRFGVTSWRTAFVRRLWCIAALLPRQYRFTQVRAFPWNPFLMVWGCFQPAFNCRGTRPCCYSCISPWAVVTGRRVLVVARFASLWGFPAPRWCWERRAGGKQLKCGTRNYLRWPKIRKQTVALW